MLSESHGQAGSNPHLQPLVFAVMSVQFATIHRVLDCRRVGSPLDNCCCIGLLLCRFTVMLVWLFRQLAGILVGCRVNLWACQFTVLSAAVCWLVRGLPTVVLVLGRVGVLYVRSLSCSLPSCPLPPLQFADIVLIDNLSELNMLQHIPWAFRPLTCLHFLLVYGRLPDIQNF